MGALRCRCAAVGRPHAGPLPRATPGRAPRPLLPRRHGPLNAAGIPDHEGEAAQREAAVGDRGGCGSGAGAAPHAAPLAAQGHAAAPAPAPDAAPGEGQAAGAGHPVGLLRALWAQLVAHWPALGGERAAPGVGGRRPGRAALSHASATPAGAVQARRGQQPRGGRS
jgi:hypothetical protein